MAMRGVRRNRLRDFRRWSRVRRVVVQYGFDMLVETDPVRGWLRRVWRRRRGMGKLAAPERLRLMLQDLGPTYVKLGQVLASRSELLPARWVAELSKLHDHVRPVPYEQVRAIINDELAAPPEEIFERFEGEPIAAASMAQVHRATLIGGQPVVVKVQRPNIESDVQADLEIIHALAEILEQRTSWAAQYNLRAAVEEFASGMMDELDLQIEARNAQRLGRSMADVPKVHVPAIYLEFVTGRILTMEQISGVKITNVDAITNAGIDRQALAITFITAMMKQILLDGFFHADPHPGNVLVSLDSGVIHFLDIGLVGYMVEEQRWLLIALIFALKERDSRELTQITLELGIQSRPVDETALRQDIERFINRYLPANMGELEFSRMMTEMFHMMMDHGLRFPRELTLAMKALAQAEEIARTLDSTIDIVRCAYDTGQGLLAEQMSAGNARRYIARQVRQTIRRIPKAQKAFDQWVKQLESGKLTVHVDHSDLVSELQHYRLLGNRAIAALMLVGLIISSTIAMSVKPPEGMSFVSALGAAGFTLSVLVSIYVILRLMFGRRD